MIGQISLNFVKEFWGSKKLGLKQTCLMSSNMPLSPVPANTSFTHIPCKCTWTASGRNQENPEQTFESRVRTELPYSILCFSSPCLNHSNTIFRHSYRTEILFSALPTLDTFANVVSQPFSKLTFAALTHRGCRMQWCFFILLQLSFLWLVCN